MVSKNFYFQIFKRNITNTSGTFDIMVRLAGGIAAMVYTWPVWGVIVGVSVWIGVCIASESPFNRNISTRDFAKYALLAELFTGAAGAILIAKYLRK